MKKILITICLLLLATLSCNYVSSGTNDETCSGVSLFKPDGSLATNATVQFYHVGDTSRQFVHQTMTDDSGRYEVKDVTASNGIFNVWAQLGDSLVAIQDSVYITATSHEVKTDTLGKPGSISGTVGLQPGDDSRTVTIQALGTHIYANVNAVGRFTLGGMAAGEYSLRLTTTLPEYADTFCNVIAKSDVADTIQDTLWLIYTGIPVVKGIVSEYDTLYGVVTLKWNKTGYKNFQDYLIYRDHADSINLSTQPIYRSTDSLFRDTILFSSTTALPFNYRVKIRNNSQKIGESYKLEKVIAVHPRNVMTTIRSSVFNKSTGLQVDTLSVGDTALIVTNFQNPSRPCKTISWSVNHPDSVNKIKILDSLSTTGKDTLVYVCSEEGDYSIYIKIEDRAGTTWSHNSVIHVWDYPSPVKLYVDSIFGHSSFLRWTKSKENGFKAYCVYYSTTPNIHSSTNPDSIIYIRTDTLFTIRNLLHSTTYFFRIGVYSKSNLISMSNEISRNTERVWITKTSMPSARAGLTSSVVNGKIYVFGGWGFGISSDRVEAYNPETDTWTIKSAMPTGRINLTSCAVEGKIYVIGGNDTSYSNVVEEYDPLLDKWSTKTPIPTARYSLTSSVVNGKIYVIGGYDTSHSNVVEEYDPLVDKWTTKTPMPTARSWLTSSVVNGKIYAIGGHYGNAGEYSDMIEEYNPATDTWVLKTHMPTVRCNGFTSTVVNDKIYVIGGISGIPGIVEKYNCERDTWAQKTFMPTPRFNLTSSSVNGKIYSIGGEATMVVMSTIEEYNPSVDK